MLGTFVACSKDDDTNDFVPQPTERTVIVYMSGENRLSPYIDYNLKEMKEGSLKIGKDDCLLVYVDKSKRSELPWMARIRDGQVTDSVSLADMGMAIDTDQSANLRFSLPNKIFDYIKAGLPMVVSNLVERARIVRQYKVGTIAESVTPEALAAAVKELSDPELLAQCRENCKTAARELTWENEEKVLEQVYAPYL